jgi:hypothetical protein
MSEDLSRELSEVLLNVIRCAGDESVSPVGPDEDPTNPLDIFGTSSGTKKDRENASFLLYKKHADGVMHTYRVGVSHDGETRKTKHA